MWVFNSVSALTKAQMIGVDRSCIIKRASVAKPACPISKNPFDFHIGLIQCCMVWKLSRKREFEGCLNHQVSVFFCRFQMNILMKFLVIVSVFSFPVTLLLEEVHLET